jgi:hypothetical protein
MFSCLAQQKMEVEAWQFDFSPISFLRQNGNWLAACGPRTGLKHKNCRDKRMDLVKRQLC